MKHLLILLLILLSPPALALSCVKPSVERSFKTYDEAKETYLVVRGRLTLDERLLPRSDFGSNEAPPMTEVTARLSGKSLSQAGFKLPFDKGITLEVACFGPWCGDISNGIDALVFLRKDGPGRYALDLNPCGGAVFQTPHLDQLKSVQRCMRGEDCTAD